MGNYSAQWQDYRRRHRAAVVALLAGIPAAALLAFPIIQLTGSVTAALLTTFSIWGVVWAWLAFRVVRFPCPRCGTQLQSGHGCANCKLMPYEEA